MIARLPSFFFFLRRGRCHRHRWVGHVSWVGGHRDVGLEGKEKRRWIGQGRTGNRGIVGIYTGYMYACKWTEKKGKKRKGESKKKHAVIDEHANAAHDADEMH